MSEDNADAEHGTLQVEHVRKDYPSPEGLPARGRARS